MDCLFFLLGMERDHVTDHFIDVDESNPRLVE